MSRTDLKRAHVRLKTRDEVEELRDEVRALEEVIENRMVWRDTHEEALARIAELEDGIRRARQMLGDA